MALSRRMDSCLRRNDGTLRAPSAVRGCIGWGRRGVAPSPLIPRRLVIPAKAGIWPIPDFSTLSRRVRGVLSPYRERGIGARCAPARGRNSRFRGNDEALGIIGRRGALRLVMALSRRMDSGLRRNDGTLRAPSAVRGCIGSRETGRVAPQTGRSPVSPDPQPHRHSRESGNLPPPPDSSTLSRRVRGVLSP